MSFLSSVLNWHNRPNYRGGSRNVVGCRRSRGLSACKLAIEPLEQRMLLSLSSGVDGDIDIGPIAESSPYTLTLMTNDRLSKTIAAWEVDWGDGLGQMNTEHFSAAQVAALSGRLPHDYTDGEQSHSITVTMIDTAGNAHPIAGGTARAFDPALDVGTEMPPIEPVAGYTIGNTVALQSTGKIVVAQPDSNGNYLLQRFNADGSLDAKFGTGGTLTTDVNCRGLAVAVIQADDGIMLIGCKPSASEQAESDNWQLVLQHYDADGLLDTSFGVGGTESTGFFVVGGTLQQAESIDVLAASTIQTDNGNAADFGVGEDVTVPLGEVDITSLLGGDMLGDSSGSYQMLMLGDPQTHVWDGDSDYDGDGVSWTDAHNWDDDQVPKEGDILVFGLAASTYNDFDAGTIFRSITFADSGITLEGNAIGLIDRITVGGSATDSTITLGIALAGPLTIDVGGSLDISGEVSGRGTLTKTGAGTLTLGGANTYLGITAIQNGTLGLGNENALGSTDNAVHVNGEDAVLDLGGYDPTVAAVVLSDGSITDTAVTRGTLSSEHYHVINGLIGANLAGDGGLTKIGYGTVTLSGNNSYSGLTTVCAGTLTFVGPAAWDVVTEVGYTGANIKGGKLVLDYNYPEGETPAGTVGSLLTTSYYDGGGKFAGGKFMSTTAIDALGLGWMDNALEHPQQLSVARTWYGDASVDGTVDLTDLTALGQNWNQTGKVWAQADFNYDGSVNLSDLTLLGRYWNVSLLQPPLVLYGLNGNSVNEVNEVNAGFSYTLELGDVPPEVTVVRYTIDWGDGEIDTYDSEKPLPQTRQVAHLYANAFAIPVITVTLRDENNIDYAGVAGMAITVREPSLRVWSGGGTDDDWTTHENWGGTAPVEGDELCFCGDVQPDTDNNFPDETVFRSIAFASSAFTVAGAPFTVTEGIAVNAEVTAIEISADVILDGAIEIYVAGDSDLTISGIMSGDALTKTGQGTSILNGMNTYTGLTTVVAGVLQLGPSAHAPVLGSGSAGADVQGVCGKLVLDYAGGDNPVETVKNLLRNGYASKFASGQIHSSTANEHKGLGWFDAVGTSRVTIRRSLYGDANLDRAVNLGDLTLLGQSWNQSNKVWAQGDFTYEGSVNLSDITRLGQNWNKSVDFGDVDLSDGDTFDVQLTDTGPNPIDCGVVILDNATLNVTSTATYDVLRTLISNDKTNPVWGTFEDLPEGAPVVVDGTTYYITYKYNGEAGGFGTGNDVAVSPLFWVSPAIVAPVISAQWNDSYLDATRYARTYQDQFQLSSVVWSEEQPQFTYEALDPSVATVDAAGLVTFLQYGTHTARFRVTTTAPGVADPVFDVELSGTVEDKVEYYVPDVVTSENVGDYVLVLYNAGSTASGDLKDYYLGLNDYDGQGRPGVQNANVLGITGVDDATYASASQCSSLVSQVSAWMQANPTKPIRYIVSLCGLPSRQATSYGTTGPSVSYMLYTEMLAGTGKSGYVGGSGTNRFTVAEYGAPLIAWLDCGSYAATKAYINKEIVTAAAGGLTTVENGGDGITISGSAAGVGGTAYFLDDTSDGDYYTYFDSSGSGNYYSALIEAGVSANDIDYNPDGDATYIDVVTDPTAYGCWGSHSGVLGGNWPTLGNVTVDITTLCEIDETEYYMGWWIGMSVESYNGVYGCSSQGDPTEIFAATAFGGTTSTATIDDVDYTYYVNMPICWVGSTNEPQQPGCEGAAYFSHWSLGWSTIDSAWSGLRLNPFTGVSYPLVVTDVFVIA